MREGFVLGDSGGGGEQRTIFIVHECAFSLSPVAQDEFCRLYKWSGEGGTVHTRKVGVKNFHSLTGFV